jgi:hypothetical protein
MTPEQLIAALQDRDHHIAKLESQCKRLKTSVATVSPNKQPNSLGNVKEQVRTLRRLIYNGLKIQMKWKPSCKRGTARFSYEGVCDEPTFRAFMKLGDKDKTKGKRTTAEEFEDNMLGGDRISASIRYGCLYARGNISVTFIASDGIIKVSGGYGL